MGNSDRLLDLSGRDLIRTTFRTSRLSEFCSLKELTAQTGHQPGAWAVVTLKELVDNALDACEEARVAPIIEIMVTDSRIVVSDNGPGLPEATIVGVMDFTTRVSSREAYVAPDRGAQGNALKTLLAMPFALSGDHGTVRIRTLGRQHTIEFSVDPIRREPVISHRVEASDCKKGTQFEMHWPKSASSTLLGAKPRFLQMVEDYSWLNPHASFSVDWLGETYSFEATNPGWLKWVASDPTSAHWYGDTQLERLVAGYIAYDRDREGARTVRDFVAEFKGFSGSAKQKRILDKTGLHRLPLEALVGEDGLDRQKLETLLSALKVDSKPVKPDQLGVIGRPHLEAKFRAAGCEMESFSYKKVTDLKDGLPTVIEAAFGWCPNFYARRLVTGVNWSPGILNPFRELGDAGRSLDSLLGEQWADRDEPIIFFLHTVNPRVEFTDRGKSAVVIAQ